MTIKKSDAVLAVPCTGCGILVPIQDPWPKCPCCNEDLELTEVYCGDCSKEKEDDERRNRRRNPAENL